MADDKLVIKPKKIKGEDGFKTFSIRIREDTVTRIDKISSQTNRSRNELIGTLLEYALDRCSVEQERTPQISSNFNKPRK